MYINYVILPTLNIGFFLYFTINPHYNLKIEPLESWIVFFTIICLTRLVEFQSTLKKIVLDDARIYLQTRKQKQQGELNEAEPANEDQTYEARAIRKVITDLKNDDA